MESSARPLQGRLRKRLPSPKINHIKGLGVNPIRNNEWPCISLNFGQTKKSW